MIVLHISIYQGLPYLFTESFKMGNLKDLQKAAKSIDLDFKILKKDTLKFSAWLPSQNDIPIPSTPLLSENQEEISFVKLTPFEISALPLTPELVLYIYNLAKNGNIPGSGILFGNSIHYAGHLMLHALKIVTNESFMPSITKHDAFYYAYWLAVTDDPFVSTINKLSLNAPHICFCLSETKDKEPVVSFNLESNIYISSSVDWFIRNNNSDKNIKPTLESVHDAWLNALTSNDALIKWEHEEEIDKFYKDIQAWIRPINLTVNSKYKLCLRLNEPSEENSNLWEVKYLLQPISDQSLYLTLADVWKRNTMANKYLESNGGIPTEFILTSLGQASRLCDYISDSLRKKHPSSFFLKTNDAANYLIDYAEALSSLGLTIILPSWWIKKDSSKSLRLKMKSKDSKMQGNKTHLNLESLAEFDYEVSLGDEHLSLEELITIANLKSTLVKIKGKWTHIDRSLLEKAIKFLQNKKSGSLTLMDIMAISLGAQRKEGDLIIDSVETDMWMNQFISQLKGYSKYTILEQPKNLLGELRPYQLKGYSYLSFLKQWGLGACLADDMGLGKTIQTLALLQNEKNLGGSKPSLLICPTSVTNTWKNEALKFTPDLNIYIHHGTDRYKKAAFGEKIIDYDIIVSTYNLLQRDIEFIKDIKWSGVILDESQNIKNSETKQSKAVRMLNSDFKIALTGTPVENHIGDLWSLMDFLNPGLLGTKSYFKNTFFKPIQIYGDTNKIENLKSLAGPFMLRRVKTDKTIIKDLPEKIETKEYCNLTKEQASLYASVINDMQEELESAQSISRKGLILSILLKLKQICNHPALFISDNSQIANRSGKMNRLIEILTDINEVKEKTLIFTQFTSMGSILQEHLQEYFGEKVYYLHGGTPKKKRDKMISNFQNDENAPKIFILSLKAGGTGITLTNANHVIHFDRWWNPAVENQATDRVFRIGQKRNVHVHKFIVEGTLEEKIDEMIEDKMGLAENIVSTGEKWLTELSNDAIKDLIKLKE